MLAFILAVSQAVAPEVVDFGAEMRPYHAKLIEQQGRCLMEQCILEGGNGTCFLQPGAAICDEDGERCLTEDRTAIKVLQLGEDRLYIETERGLKGIVNPSMVLTDLSTCR